MRLAILLCVLTLSFGQNANAQCCAAGNPNSGGSASGMTKNAYSISSSYVHSFSDSYFQGNSPYEFDYLNNTKFDFSLLTFNYGLSNKLSLSTEIGYFIDKSMEYSFIDATRKAGGLGDAALALNYHLDSYKEQYLNVFTSLKLTVPVGEFDQMDGNIILPIDIQPSAGSFRMQSSFRIHKGFFGSKFSLSTLWSAEFAQRINTERTDYKYGNLYNCIFQIGHKTNSKLNSGLSVILLHREKAGNFGAVMNSTGGSFVSLQPSVGYQIQDDLSINSSIDLPVYRNVNGIQMVNKYQLVLGVTKSFNPQQLKSKIDYTILESLNEKQFFVDGICGMCKDRIEALAYKVKGIKWAEWDLATKTLTVKYKNTFDEEKLAKTLAKGGHDNWVMKANEKAYQSLHSCCKYRTGN